MSHLQQSLELKWLFLKAATTQEILYFILPKEKKKRQRSIGQNAAGSQSNQIA